jgi:hypothetical protein
VQARSRGTVARAPTEFAALEMYRSRHYQRWKTHLRGSRRRRCMTRGGRRGQGARAPPRRWPTGAPGAPRPCATPPASPSRPHRRLRRGPLTLRSEEEKQVGVIRRAGRSGLSPTSASPRHCSSTHTPWRAGRSRMRSTGLMGKCLFFWTRKRTAF